jgi:hypothetical protein
MAGRKIWRIRAIYSGESGGKRFDEGGKMMMWR